jgi:A/G-specific adenine glycosylase
VDEAARQRVLTWGVANMRDLPWRRTRDPWAVLVSEVMLQQTQVERVIPRWFEFLDHYPTPSACAAVSLGDVLRLWQGLGYPRRARNLHAAAQAIDARGEFPRTLEGLRALPGVGAYTARAILTFAFEDRAAVVDTNIARVFARLAGARLTGSVVQRMADHAVDGEQSWAWNQCLMDIGAMLCRPLQPACADCPLQSDCAWRGIGEDPAVSSAGVSGRQSPFEGSDRQGRGRLLKALGRGPVDTADVSTVMGWPDQRARADRLATSLVADGLAVVDGGSYRLP